MDISESKNSDLLGPAKVSLGALGIITSVTLQCVPAFNLRILEFTAKLPEIISRFEFEESNADFVEFFWFPHTEIAEIKIAVIERCKNSCLSSLTESSLRIKIFVYVSFKILF